MSHCCRGDLEGIEFAQVKLCNHICMLLLVQQYQHHLQHLSLGIVILVDAMLSVVYIERHESSQTSSVLLLQMPIDLKSAFPIRQTPRNMNLLLAAPLQHYMTTTELYGVICQCSFTWLYRVLAPSFFLDCPSSHFR